MDETNDTLERVVDQDIFRGKMPAHYDPVNSEDVSAFMQNRRLLAAQEREYESRRAMNLKIAKRWAQRTYGEWSSAHTSTSVQDQCASRAMLSLYAENPALTIAWLAADGNWWHLHKLILLAGENGLYLKLDPETGQLSPPAA